MKHFVIPRQKRKRRGVTKRRRLEDDFPDDVKFEDETDLTPEELMNLPVEGPPPEVERAHKREMDRLEAKWKAEMLFALKKFKAEIESGAYDDNKPEKKSRSKRKPSHKRAPVKIRKGSTDEAAKRDSPAPKIAMKRAKTSDGRGHPKKGYPPHPCAQETTKVSSI